MKKQLIEEICIFLLKNGFTTKILRYCFDILARKDSKILLIKVIEDANSLDPKNMEEMLKICSYTSACPLILAEKSGRKLEDNIVYTRSNVFTINLRTFQNAINNKFPFIKSNKSGLSASVIGKKLRDTRESLNLSSRSLARKINVSPRMISKYENEDSDISLDKAIKLYRVAGREIFEEINIFHKDQEIITQDKQNKFTRKFQELGFSAIETKKAPFDIIAKDNKEVILTSVGDKIDHELLLISKLMDTDDLVIFNKKRPRDIPSLSKEEFMEIDKAKELIKIIKES